MQVSGKLSITHISIISSGITHANFDKVIEGISSKSAREAERFMSRIDCHGNIAAKKDEIELKLVISEALKDKIERVKEILSCLPPCRHSDARHRKPTLPRRVVCPTSSPTSPPAIITRTTTNPPRPPRGGMVAKMVGRVAITTMLPVVTRIRAASTLRRPTDFWKICAVQCYAISTMIWQVGATMPMI